MPGFINNYHYFERKASALIHGHRAFWDLPSRGVQRLLTLCALWAAVLNGFMATVRIFMNRAMNTMDSSHKWGAKVISKHHFRFSSALNSTFVLVSWTGPSKFRYAGVRPAGQWIPAWQASAEGVRGPSDSPKDRFFGETDHASTIMAGWYSVRVLSPSAESSGS